jgi:hypothetical protein
MKGEYITIIVFAIILAVSLLLIMIYREELFKRKQSDKKNSLLEGYGFYSDPITLPCTNNTGKCTEPSTQKTIFKCIPHPSTGKGCIDDKGHMTYDYKVLERPCQQQCLGSLFTVNDAVDYKNININGKENQLLQGIGCNKVANTKTGFDETNFFIGDFDTNNLKYKLKNCIPENYQGYYTKTYTCNNYDTTGANNCRYTCGQDGSIKLNGLFDTKSSKNVLMYYPTEFDQEGVKRHICYDINDVNQIEILNSVTEVPNDFYYPNICYKHVNENKIPDLIELYPAGNKNIISSTLNYNIIQEKFFFNNFYNMIENLPTLLSSNYDYYYDYENYIKLQLNNEVMLVNKINTNIEGTFLNNNFDNDNIIMYINTNDNNLDNNIDNIEYTNSSGTYVAVNFYHDKFYQLDTIENKVKVINQYIPINIAPMLDSEEGPVDVAFGLSTTTIGDPNKILSPGDLIYYRGVTNNYNNGRLVSIIDTGSSTGIINNIILNRNEKIYWRKLNAKINNNNLLFNIERKSDSKLLNFSIDYTEFLLTNNIFLKNGQNYNNNKQLLLTRSIDTLSYYNNDAFFLFDKEVQLPPVKSTTYGFFYPLYLKKFEYDTTDTTAEGTKIFFTTEPNPGINRDDKILINDISTKPFFITETSTGVPLYYYPVYLVNTTYTNSITFPDYEETIFYLPSNASQAVANKPEEYLNYLDFNQYSTLAMVYKDTSDIFHYPVFLSKNFTDTHNHTFINYKDITFYMPNINNNHALNEPPKRDYKLTDFKDLFEIGTVNVNLNNYNISNITFTIPNNAQINQQVFLPEFIPSSNVNNDIQIYQDGNSIANIIYNTVNNTGSIISVFRENDNLLNKVSGDTIFTQKSKLYNQILTTQAKKIVNDNSRYDTIVNPEKKLLVAADFKLFQSPYIENPDGTTTNICYDKYNKPLATGTQVTLNSPSKGGTNNNTIVINVPCSNFNTDIGASCGVLGLSIGSQPCQQERESSGYNVKTDVNVLNPNGDYMNEYGYMENGLDIVENKMVCLNKFRDPYNPDDETKCFPPYFTREEVSGKKYAPDEELYLTRFKQDYYLSTTNDNTNYPLNPLFWDRIFIPTPDAEVSNYQTLFYKNSNNNYIFRTNQSGVTGLEPNQLAIQPVFRKNIAPYHNYNEFNPGSTWWDRNNQLAKKLNTDNTDKDLFNYNAIGISFGGNNISSLGSNPESYDITNQVFIITYQDKTIKNLNLEVGDIFQTGFTFFNPLIQAILTNANNFLNLDKYGAIISNDNNNFYNLNTTTFICSTLSTQIKVGDYLVIVPTALSTGGGDLYNPPAFQEDIIDNNSRELFNPCFEIVLVTKINDKTLTVERNILNLNSNNYFYPISTIGYGYQYGAFPIKDSLLDLNFPITNISEDKISFQITLDVPYSWASTGLTGNFPINESLAFTPFISANYIKKSVTIPNQTFGDNNQKLYLASMSTNAKTISALLDVRSETSDGVAYLYINEFRSSRYTTNDDFKTSFQIGDTIDLEFDTDSKLSLRVIRTNIFFKNDIYDKRYDYYCSILEGSANDINSTNLSQYTHTINKDEYYLAYYYNGSTTTYPSTWWPNITVLKTPRPGFENSMTITVYDVTTGAKKEDTNITLEGMGFFPLDNNEFKSKVPIHNNNKYLSQSKILSEANQIAYLRLSATTFTSEKGTISINNIKTIGKPEGIIYYPNVNVDNNTPNRNGFGAITSFQIATIDVNPSVNEGDEFISRSNYILRATDKNIAGYDYVTGDITSINTILNYNDTTTYSEKQIVDYINPNQRIYYRNVTDESSSFNLNTWQARAESIYNESSVIDFVLEESYLKGTVVKYQGRLWKANDNLFSGTSYPSSTSGWEEITLTELDLYSNQNNFFTFSNESPSITNEQIIQFNELNINNYPLCVSDYANKTNYCPQPNVKFTDKILDFSNSFISVLPGASSLASIMGQGFLTHKEDEYLSLPAVPYSAKNYKSAQYLKDSGDIAAADNLVQYIYQIPILNGLDEGKPYCTNDWLDSGVSDITFANSIVFFMLPLDINSQDYPVFDVSQNGTILTKNNFNSINNRHFGMSMISFKDNNPVLVDIGTSDATFITSEYDNKFKSGDNILLTKIGGGSSVNVTINNQGYYPINQARIINEGSGYKLGDIWYFTDTDKEILARGYLQPSSSGGSINAGSFVSYYTNFSKNRYNTNGLSIISENGSGFDYNWNDNKWKEIIDYTISEPQNFTAGTYKASLDDILEIHIADNGQGEPLQYNQYLIGTSSPAGQLTDGVSAYQIFNHDSFKCRMYGLFGSDYLSNISYRLDNNLINNLNQENPGLLFNNFTTDIFSNSAICVGVVTENTSTPDYITDIYDVFNIKSNDGTSSNITLLTNNFSMPVDNIKSQPLPLAYNSGQLREFNIVNTTDLHDFFSVPYSDTSNIYMGSVNKVLPVLEDFPNNNVIKFSAIRQSRGRQNIGTSFDCNFYFKPQSIVAGFPSGGEYNLTQQNNIFYYKLDDTSGIINSNNGLNIKSNLEYSFNLTDSSMDNFPLSFSTTSGQKFEDNIIKTESTIIGNGTLNIFYYINDAQIDYSDYSKSIFYKLPNAQRRIKIYYDTGLENMTSSITIYMGFDNFYNNNLTISNNQ